MVSKQRSIVEAWLDEDLSPAMNMTTDHAHEVADEEVSKSPSTGCYARFIFSLS